MKVEYNALYIKNGDEVGIITKNYSKCFNDRL